MSETNYNKEEFQRLIDLLFEIARTSARSFGTIRMTGPVYRRNKEKDHMKWIAKVLRDHGWDTVPQGKSFGTLKEK